MFDPHIQQAKSMIERLQRCKDEGIEQVPSDVPVSESELSIWYAGVYNEFVKQFGKDSAQFKDFWDARARAQEHPNAWTRTPGGSPEPAYIRYLQTMIAFMRRYSDEQPVTKVTLMWLFKNVPVKLWLSAASLLIAAFYFGTQAARVAWVRELLWPR